ncbi:MAG: tripartite tricarboxylate transporter substrate-binding protein [Phreatobacter sp.]
MSRLVASVAALLGLVLVPAPTLAQQPLLDRAINLHVGFAAGGPADVLARVVAEKLRETNGQTVVVVNRAGAGGTLAAAAVAKAAPDGANLLLVTSGHAGAPALYPNLSFDNQRDFAAVIALAQSPIVVLVNGKSRYRTLQDLLDAARANPGKLNFGTGGGGATLTALSAMLLRKEVGFDAVVINFPGSGPANVALMGNVIDFQFDTLSGAVGLLASGDLRALAVSTATRSSILPDVPTVAEAVRPGFDVTGWFGILAPAGTDPALVARLNAAINAALQAPDVRQKLALLGIEPIGGAPQQFGALIASETVRWGGLIRELGLRVD